MVSTVRRLLVATATWAGLWRVPTGQAQAQGMDEDTQVLARAATVAEGSRISLMADRVNVDSLFLPRLEAALERLEAISSRALDVATFGPRVKVVVSSATRVSHVWRGYAHPSDPRAIVFLNPRVVHDAMLGRDATYVHELAHLVTWRFHSHTLREGLADYLALQIVPDAGIGPMRPGAPPPEQVDAEIKALLGSRLPPPAWLASDATRRRDYYWACRRFVQALVERHDLATFLRLYDSPHPERDLVALYGADQPTLVRLAGL